MYKCTDHKELPNIENLLKASIRIFANIPEDAEIDEESFLSIIFLINSKINATKNIVIAYFLSFNKL